MSLTLLTPAVPASAQGWSLAAMGFLIGAGLAGVFLALRLRREINQEKQLEAKLATVSQDLDRSSQTLQGALAAIENENFTDTVTDLRNRRYLSAVIKSDVAKVQRVYRDSGPQVPPNQDLIFLMVDLDHFSRIMDFYNPGAADQVLIAVSQALRRAFRETDAIIRWGGDEFLVVARNSTRSEGPELAERIRRMVAGLSVETSKGVILRCTCCVGFTAFPFQPTDFGWLGWDRVVEIADACSAVAKLSGRNAWVGVQATSSLDRAKHGPKIPKELKQLADEGVIQVFSSREDPFGKAQRTGEILG